MSTLLCACGNVVPIEEAVLAQCRSCHERPLKEAVAALRPFAETSYEYVEFDRRESRLRSTFSKFEVRRARLVVDRADRANEMEVLQIQIDQTA